MKPFDQFWEAMIQELDKPTEICGWTRDQEFTNKDLVAQSFRSLPRSSQVSISGNLLENSWEPEWITCREPEATVPTGGASAIEFRDRYQNWPRYKNGQIPRSQFGPYSPSGYVLSLFKNFDYLTENTRELKCRILIVEDDDEVRELTADFLLLNGARVFAECAYKAAAAQVRTFMPEIAILKMTAKNPQWIDTAEKIRNIRPQTKIIFIGSDLAAVKEAQKAKFLHFIPGWANLNELTQLIRMLQDNR